MEKHISFGVENVELIENPDSSQFAILKIDAFSSGINRHNIYISEDTLRKTAKTILEKPIVWKFDKYTNDAGSHDAEEVPCGFVPASSPIEFKSLPDGRVMLTVWARLWKRYAGKLVEIFNRDNNKKDVSVELEVLDSTSNEQYKAPEITDYKYFGITVLGSRITPAIPGAMADMVAFAKYEKNEYQKIYEQEFSKKYADVDLSIPEKIKQNACEGLSLYEKYGIGGTSISLAIARHIAKNSIVEPSKVRAINKRLKLDKSKAKAKENPDSNYISWMLHGGDEACQWSQDIVDKLDEIDSRRLSYFGKEETMPYKSLGEINPALKGIEPPITLAQANKIAEVAESVGSDEKKNGWAIAISQFRKTHVVKDGKWVEKGEDNAVEEEPKEGKESKQAEENAECNSAEQQDEKSDSVETCSEGEKEPEEKDEKEEDEKGEEKDMSLDSNLDVAVLLEMLKDDTEDYKEIVTSSETGNLNLAKVCSMLMGKITKITEEKMQAEKDKDAYMGENVALKQFKADVEAQKFAFEVEQTLNEVSKYMPKAELEKARENSKNFSLETVDAWKNSVKATAFSFTKEEKKQENFVRMGLPFVKKEGQNNGSPWTR